MKDILKEFDKQFGKTIVDEDGYLASEGRRAGCDDCETNQELRKEVRDFIEKHLTTN